MLVGSSIAAKEKEIKNALSYGNEISTKLDAARKTLNDEIAKLNTN
jgi:prefoldin subunit 5